MKRVLFAVGISGIDALGSVTRLVAIAQELVINSDQVKILFRASGREAEYIRNLGFEVVEGYKPGVMGMPGGLWKFINELNIVKDIKSPQISSMDQVIKLKGIFTKKYVFSTYREWIDILDSFKPDVIISEFDLIAPIVAYERGIKFFNTLQTPMLEDFNSSVTEINPGLRKKLTKYYNRLLKMRKLPRVSSTLSLLTGYRNSINIVPSIPEMEELNNSEKLIYSGMLIPDSTTNFKIEKKSRLVYVYLSVSQITGREVESVITEAFSHSDYSVVVSCAGSPYLVDRINRSGGLLKSGNVYFYKFLPTIEVLKKADLVIHHGGQNTTLQAIEAQVPSLIFPCDHFERDFNGRKAMEFGCAKLMKRSDFTPKKIIDSCNKIILDESVNKSLKKGSEEIKKSGGAGRIVREILS